MDSTVTDAMVPRRHRKAHRKSRLGCKNCKLRSVKCDESKPACKRCQASGFCCDFSSQGPMLQLQHAGVYRFDLSLSSQGPSPRYSIPIVLPCSTAFGEYELRPEDFAALDRYRNRTLNHIGTKESRPLFSDENGGTGVSHPFLLHMFIALALIHDSCSPSPFPSTEQGLMSFHWYQASAIFRRMLSQGRFGVTVVEHDALWATSVLLGAASFAYLGTHDPKKTWPFRDPDPSDLSWIKMGDGKKAVGETIGPVQDGTAFQKYRTHIFTESLPRGDAPIPLDVFPQCLYTLFDQFPSTDSEVDVYYRPASILAQILPHPFIPGKLGRFISFTIGMEDSYKDLLAQKDPRALLLLVWYYAKLVECKLWWMRQRAIIEGMSICLYLESKHAHALILEALVWPRMVLSSAYQHSLDTNGGLNEKPQPDNQVSEMDIQKEIEMEASSNSVI
ncbi:unnamed protein product [Clonostachys solani]|uniref:Zn(2)-C6 fungal-type domain-containing protein n=1 Tax=Clonostachys solani TaxID=160281 RepID=A0A9N9ZAI8_9HYPO|nr:unnamed protein product [Clonostachys solani]